MKYMPRNDWRNYVLGHSMHGVESSKTANVISSWIKVYLKECKVSTDILEDRLAALKPRGTVETGSDEWERNKVTMVLGRWKQIERLCEDALRGLVSP